MSKPMPMTTFLYALVYEIKKMSYLYREKNDNFGIRKPGL